MPALTRSFAPCRVSLFQQTEDSAEVTLAGLFTDRRYAGFPINVGLVQAPVVIERVPLL